jgi:hypothetical protein
LKNWYRWKHDFSTPPTGLPSSQRPHGTNPAGLLTISPGSPRLNTAVLKLPATWSRVETVSSANGATRDFFSIHGGSSVGIVIAFNYQKRVLWFTRHCFPWFINKLLRSLAPCSPHILIFLICLDITNSWVAHTTADMRGARRLEAMKRSSGGRRSGGGRKRRGGASLMSG